MAANPVAYLAPDGVLVVNGSSKANAIRVELDADDPTRVIVSRGSTTRRFLAAAVERVSINARGGDDVVVTTLDVPTKIRGGRGNDRLDANQLSVRARLYGEAGDDTLTGGEGGDLLVGGDGNDLMEARGGRDVLVGGAGADVLGGGGGFDFAMYNDRTNPVNVTIGGGADDGEAGEGDFVGNSIDAVIGGAGDDRLSAGEYAALLFGGAGNDTLTGGQFADSLAGGAGDDQIDGGGGDDGIWAQNGNDVMIGSAGADVYRGGLGFDVVNYADVGFAVTVTVGDGPNDGIFGGVDGADVTGDVESVIGTNFDDTITAAAATGTHLIGGAGNDTLTGGTGDDTIEGGDGDDRVFDGDGFDILFGDAGNDTFVVTYDFKQDQIDGGLGSDTYDRESTELAQANNLLSVETIL